ncbi:MAG: hypothetical protein JWM28_1554, partial [Chitinophagaceae bacterium]|nr:hypothetical protein [Chitinophagaceae bacterium]
MSAADLLKNKIRQDGPISFKEFMETALYDPCYGYYRAGRERTGKTGDFYTSPCFTPLFGEMIAKQIEEMWNILGKKEFSIIEFGGNNGRLCLDILERLKENHELYKGLQYYIIEKSIVAGNKNAGLYHGKVCWLQNSVGLKNINGCILSNELLDNFPVHIAVMEDQLQEVFVDYSDDKFTEIRRKDDGKLQAYLSTLKVHLPKGFRTEINLDVLSWLQEISGILDRGFVLTIDYGAGNHELYNNKRREGTLVCYYRHTINFNPYIHIGDQDITSHVNFSALYHWGLKNQLDYTGFTTQ